VSWHSCAKLPSGLPIPDHPRAADNGSCFSTIFKKACAELEAQYRHTQPYTHEPAAW
jgi:hypothetical protein